MKIFIYRYIKNIFYIILIILKFLFNIKYYLYFFKKNNITLCFINQYKKLKL